MRRPRLVTTLLLCLVAVGVAVALKHRPPVLPLGECSEVYRQCVGADGIEASYIHGRRFDDSTRLDMTVLRADDSAAWVRLLGDLGFSDEWITVNSAYYTNSSPAIHMATCVRGHPSQTPTETDTEIEFLSFQWSSYKLSIFHLKSPKQNDIIIKHLFHETFNSTIQ